MEEAKLSSDADKSAIGKARSIQLPHVFVIGFTGHRQLQDEALCRVAIRKALEEQVAVPNRTVCAVASVAAGADLLFAECCLDLQIPLQVLLPAAADEFREDFEAGDWERAEKVMQSALSVTVVSGVNAGTERYYECGIETVLRAQMLMTVWNGLPAGGVGGTQEIVDFARQVGRPVIWIESRSGIVQSIPEKSERTEEESELRFLNALTDAGVNASGSSPSDLAQAWLAKLDANAVLVAPQVRRLSAIPIVCTALAALLSGSASRLPAAALWAGLGAVLGLTAAVLPAALQLGKRQALWVRIRTAAEVTRSVLALWDTSVRYQVIGQEVLPELAGMVRSLNLLKVQAGQEGTADLSQFKKKYLDDRVRDQMRYFSAQVRKAAAQGRKFRRISKVTIAFAVVLSAFTMGSRLLAGHTNHVGSRPWLPLLTSAFFQMATIAGALVVVHDCDRRERRYHELYETLSIFDAELSAFRTWPPAARVVEKIERALLIEILEWRSLLQNRKMPKD